MSVTELSEFPLTLFEKYFLLDASDEFPMLVDGVFHFSGRFKPEKFEEAVRECLERQPLFLRKIERRKGDFFWVPCDGPFEIQWPDTPPDLNGVEWNEPIDLFKRNGLDLYVYHQNEETKVYYRCHHICTDGAGFYRFIGEVLAAYAVKCGTTVKMFKPVVQERILDRADFKPGELPGKIGFWRIVYDTFREIVRWLHEKPLFIGRRKNEVTGPRFGRKTYVIGSETVKRCRIGIRSAGCTLNDLLIAAFFELLWKRETEQNQRREQNRNRIRLMIPVNMRWPGSEDIPAANMISYVFLTKKKADCDSNLLRVVHDEMQVIKNWQVGYIFLDALRFFDRVPGGLRMMTSGKKCLASMVFSNMGSVERCFGDTFPDTGPGIVDIGDLRLEYLESFAPCRHLTNLSVAACFQSDRLVLCCEYDRVYLAEEELDTMFGVYEAILEKFC